MVSEVNQDCKALKFCGEPFSDEEAMYCDKNGRYVRITEKDCAKCKSPVFTGITRADAVERMAKSLCQIDNFWETCGMCRYYKKKKKCKAIMIEANYINRAEAALDALLCKEFKNAK